MGTHLDVYILGQLQRWLMGVNDLLECGSRIKSRHVRERNERNYCDQKQAQVQENERVMMTGINASIKSSP